MPIQVTVSELEIGPYHINIWGEPNDQLLELGEAIHKALPKEMQKLNHPQLNLHADPMFHPLGTPDILGRKPFRHLHILYPHPVSHTDVFRLLDLMKENNIMSFGGKKLLITNLIANVDPTMTNEEINNALARSAHLAAAVIKQKLNRPALALDEYLEDLEIEINHRSRSKTINRLYSGEMDHRLGKVTSYSEAKDTDNE